MYRGWYKFCLMALLLSLLAACGTEEESTNQNTLPEADASDVSGEGDAAPDLPGEDTSEPDLPPEDDTGQPDMTPPEDMAQPDLIEDMEPDLTEPDLANPDMDTPDVPPSDMADPDTVEPDADDPDLVDPDAELADMPEPDGGPLDMGSPDMDAPDTPSPDADDPDIVDADEGDDMDEVDPDMVDPDMDSPDMDSPDLDAPDAVDLNGGEPDMEPGDTVEPDADDPDIVDPDAGDMDEPDTPEDIPGQKLAEDSSTALEQVNGRQVALGAEGVPNFVVGELGQVEMQQPQEEMMIGLDTVLPSLLPVFGLQGDALEMNNVQQDEMGFMHARYAQQRDGLPVIGGDFMVHVDDQGKVFAINGAAPPSPEVRPASITPEEAIGTLSNRYEGATVETSEPDEVYLVASFDGRLYRTWRIHVEGTRLLLDNSIEPIDEDIFVDAYNGGVLDVHPHVHIIKQIAIFDAQNATNGSGVYLGQTPEELPEQDNAAWGAWENANLAYDCYSEVFLRDSFDGEGQAIRSVVHFGTRVNNAFWYPNNNVMYYGDGDGVFFSNLAESYDVTVHEMSHAVNTYTANLIYMNESGALNESFSDIMAAVCEAWQQGVLNGDTWKVGESVYTPGVPGDALRYMNNPTQDNRSYDYYPSRYQGTEDHGGVHLNSGISNLAFYLMAQGGSHPRNLTAVDVAPIGLDRAAQIFYRAVSYYMTPSTNFSQARAATVQAARDLYGGATAQSVHDAWSAVGVDAAPIVEPVIDEIIDIQNNQTVSGLGGDAGDAHIFKLTVPEGATSLTFDLGGGSGDADLSVRLGQPPTQTMWDHRPYLAGNTESLEIESPDAGDWYIMVHGFAAFADVFLAVSFAEEDPTPTTEDNCYDGVDNDEDQQVDCEDEDCAQWPDCLAEPEEVQPGDLVITEIMANPDSGQGDPRHEWFELHNTTTEAIDLQGLEITDRDGSPERVHTITQSIIVEPGAYAVLAYSTSEDLGFVPDYIYGTTRIILANSGDNIALQRNDGTLIDEVDFKADGFPGVLAGVTLTASELDAEENDDGAGWCRTSGGVYNDTGETGTPGEAGGCASEAAQPPAAGSLVITEILYNPSGSEPTTEWFEVLAVEGPLELRGLQLSAGIRSHTVEPSTVIEANQRLVFCRDPDQGPVGCQPYSRLQLANGGSVLTITGADGVEVDRVAYETTWPWPESNNGVAVELSEDHLNSEDNDSGQVWCASEAPSGDDLGTPGLPGACIRQVETRQARAPIPGEVVITEIQYSAPSEPYGEWFEVWVQAEDDTEWLDVQGVTLTTETTQFVIESPLVVPSGTLIVGCRDAEVGPTDCLQYSSLRLRNTGDTLSIFGADGELLDAVAYGVGGDWPAFSDGVSLELNLQHHNHTSNDDPANWCSAVASYDDQGLEFGSPHRPNDCGFVEPVSPGPGDLIITEILYNPSGGEPGAEWIEVRNLAEAPPAPARPSNHQRRRARAD